MMSNFEKVIEFLRLNRRSEEAEKDMPLQTEVSLTPLDDNQIYSVNKKVFEENFTKYKRIFNLLDEHNAEVIYLMKIGSERKYFVKISDGKYRNLLDESIGFLLETGLIEFPIRVDNTAYIYDTEKNQVVIFTILLKEVVLFSDYIYYDPNGKYMGSMENEVYTYEYTDHITTFGKIIKILYDDARYLWNNTEKKVQVLKSEMSGQISLIPFLQVEYGFNNFILKYRYDKKGDTTKLFLSDDQCAIVLKFTGIGGLLTFLDQTLFSQGFSLIKGDNKDVFRNYFRDQFMQQVINKIEGNLKSKSSFGYYDAMKTLFYLPESIATSFSDSFLWMLLETAIENDDLSNKKNLAEENIFVKLIRVILKKEGEEAKLMNWFLEKVKVGDKNITNFEFIYNRINGDNFLEFAKLINQTWKKSRFIYPDKEENPEFATSDGLLFLPYTSEKFLGIYFSNVNMSFETHPQKERLLKTLYETKDFEYEMRPSLKTDNLVSTKIQIVDQFWYHPFYPIYLKDIENQETELKLDSVVPAFMLKANQDKQFWSNVIASGEYVLDILTTISGAGNLAKFRYLAKFATKAGKLRFVSKAGRAVVTARKAVAATTAVIEITSGTVNALLKLTNVRDTAVGSALSEYLFWMELLSLSGELTVAIHNGLRKSAKKLVEKERDLAKLEEQLDNIIIEENGTQRKLTQQERKEILDEIGEIAELKKNVEPEGPGKSKRTRRSKRNKDNIIDKDPINKENIKRYEDFLGKWSLTSINKISKDVILAAIKGYTKHMDEVAQLLKENKIRIYIESEEDFIEIFELYATEKQIEQGLEGLTAFAYKNKMYFREDYFPDELLDFLSHEASHTKDYLLKKELKAQGKSQKEIERIIGNNWDQEERAYSHQVDWQKAIGQEPMFGTRSEQTKHIRDL
ncbi:hypothetical protein [Chryseobacterium sp. JK1]|uniref:hypothetical protein n=1 Tax=Chryseobacterium sp. JK1 TaxID=874294 RepID=UPI003D699F09